MEMQRQEEDYGDAFRDSGSSPPTGGLDGAADTKLYVTYGRQAHPSNSGEARMDAAPTRRGPGRHGEQCGSVGARRVGDARERKPAASADRTGTGVNSEPAQVKPYMHVEELARVTPWSEVAIRTMMTRGLFREGQHYFKVGRRPVFKWAAVVAFIENRPSERIEPLPHFRGGNHAEAA